MQNISLVCCGFCLAQTLELVSQTVKTGSILPSRDRTGAKHNGAQRITAPSIACAQADQGANRWPQLGMARQSPQGTPEKERKAVQTVLCPPERFIDIPSIELQTAFQGAFGFCCNMRKYWDQRDL